MNITNQKGRASACPICHRPVARRPENLAFPFCCERCRLIDLGKWLSEEYVVSEPSQQPPGPGKDGSG